MKTFKKIVVSLAMAASMAAFSTSAFSAGEDNNAKVRAAAENTLAKLQEAVSLVEQKGDKTAIMNALGEARQSQKEFRFEITERSRQKANNKLVIARESLEKGDTKEGEAALREALAIFTEMKATYAKAH